MVLFFFNFKSSYRGQTLLNLTQEDFGAKWTATGTVDGVATGHFTLFRCYYVPSNISLDKL